MSYLDDYESGYRAGWLSGRIETLDEALAAVDELIAGLYHGDARPSQITQGAQRAREALVALKDGGSP